MRKSPPVWPVVALGILTAVVLLMMLGRGLVGDFRLSETGMGAMEIVLRVAPVVILLAVFSMQARRKRAQDDAPSAAILRRSAEIAAKDAERLDGVAQTT